MLDTVYLNGQFLKLKDAKISVLDRGFLFGDAVYEAIPVYNGKPFQAKAHLLRLNESLHAIKMKRIAKVDLWLDIIHQLIEKNAGDNCQLYIQITRGVDQSRKHNFSENLTPTVFMGAIRFTPKSIDELRQGISGVILEDARWHHCHIKTTSLIANIIAKLEADASNFDEVIFVRDGFVTEATMRNVFMVKNGVLKTPRKTPLILSGITRDLVIDIAMRNHIPLEETDLTQTDFLNADEVWVTSSTLEIVPVVRLNDQLVGQGLAGPLWEKMIALYQQEKTQHDR